MERMDAGLLSLWFFLQQPDMLEEAGALYGIRWEEQQTRELIAFVREALRELQRRGQADTLSPWAPTYCPGIRITRDYRIFIGGAEVQARPMAKSVLLLFLNHPEGIVLKQIGRHREELARYYRRLSRRQDPAAIEESVDRILNFFTNDLNVNIARVNAAVRTLVESPVLYQIGGPAGEAKGILLDRSLVVWE